ncbi:MAG: gluconeogenesis factor YvcK family protein [Dehalococcoidia bacterium]
MHYGDPAPNVVVIGGGSGSSMLLRGLKGHTRNLTAIVTMFDSGGSTGLLSREFGYPPLGDLRQCLVALSNESEANEALRSAFDFRFSKDSSLNGHSMGNLMLAALTSLNSDVEGAIEQVSAMLNISGQVLPVTLQNANLCAELEGGMIVHSESEIDLRAEDSPSIRRIFLDREVEANPRAIEAIMDADAVVLGPGDLYTSILPNLLASGIPEALRETSAPLVYVCNLMTKRGETGGYRASDFASEIVRYIDGRLLDWVLVNTRPAPGNLLSKYAAEGADPVVFDEDVVAGFTERLIAAPLSSADGKMRHDPARLAEAVLSVMSLDRVNGMQPAADAAQVTQAL